MIMFRNYFKFILAITLLISLEAQAQGINGLTSFSPMVEKATPAIVNISTKQSIEVKNPFDGIDNDNDSKSSSPRFVASDFNAVIYNAGEQVVLIKDTVDVLGLRIYKRSLHTVEATTDTVFSLGTRFIIEPGVTQFREGNATLQIINGRGVFIPGPSANHAIDNVVCCCICLCSCCVVAAVVLLLSRCCCCSWHSLYTATITAALIPPPTSEKVYLDPSILRN